MSNGRPISVLFALEPGYAQHGAACIASLLRHSQAPLDVVVVSTEDPESFAHRIRRSFAHEPRVQLEFRQASLPSDTTFPIPNGLRPETYLRFWIDELMPGRERALYLDADTIVVGPVEELWEMDLGGNVLAAVPIPNSSRPATHGMPPGSLFFNAGVLLVDLEAWRRGGHRYRCLDYLRRHPERALDGDQDILNLCLIGQWLPLPYEWNVINPFYRSSHDLQLSASSVERIRAAARIVHFNGRNKPWRYMVNHPRKRDYYLNLAETDWRGARPEGLTLRNVIQKNATFYLPAWFKQSIKAFAHSVRAAGARSGAVLQPKLDSIGRAPG